MQPSKTTVTGLFSTPHQYQIPIFQRGYVWTLEKQVGPLWTDIQDRADAVLEQQSLASTGTTAALKPLQKHFLGSIVMTPVPNSFGRAPAFEVIDGQQRSTTLHLLLLAFRQAARELIDSPIPQMLDGLVRNPGPYQRAEDHYKVWPTQAGQDEMRRLSDTATHAQDVYTTYPARDARTRIERPLMVQTYLYLYHACLAYMRGVDLTDVVNPTADPTFGDTLIADIRRNNDVSPLQGHMALESKRAQALYMALADHVQIMTLTLEAEDDPQVIFETLNARGEPLLASDLVRNFVFLEAARQGQAVPQLYERYWSPFDLVKTTGQGVSANAYWREKERQGRLTYPRIDLFFYNYTILRSHEITLASHVFQSFKAWWLKQLRDLEVELAQLVASSRHFQELVSPEGTGYLAEFARLVKSLDVGTVTPVYLALRERLASDSVELRQALGDLASYLTRRAVCGLTTKGYNRFFMRVLQAVLGAPEAPHIALRNVLLAATALSEVWPDDALFSDKWCHRPVYKELRPVKTCGVLRALEYAARGSQQGSNHVPAQSDLTIEHVIPQSWEKLPTYQITDMTEAQRQIRETVVHGFGNLTLLTQPLNSSISNGPFADTQGVGSEQVLGKRSRLGQSALLLNTYFQQTALGVWDDDAIANRSKALLKAALLVWPKPVGGSAAPVAVASAISGN
ncbi:DUF262 domain-containing protein [Pseudomonas frederiksbergensis]|uniref:DUF262 domain-containing protein n=1 Tax=Pseudomonas frederiksbergensis TaxID=104087 RepID=A0A423KNG3_9PSED|nr:DUF262 domain-containing protein [Pseudomonas frederiksbergensis]RON55944.1 hypothetical protein BK665_08245 [Pseudomonas frederiksbergensis]